MVFSRPCQTRTQAVPRWGEGCHKSPGSSPENKEKISTWGVGALSWERGRGPQNHLPHGPRAVPGPVRELGGGQVRTTWRCPAERHRAAGTQEEAPDPAQEVRERSNWSIWVLGSNLTLPLARCRLRACCFSPRTSVCSALGRRCYLGFPSRMVGRICVQITWPRFQHGFYDWDDAVAVLVRGGWVTL